MEKPLIILKDVSWAYPQSGEWALRKINLETGEGEFLAVMGENGSGKTTFCRLFNGIIPHSQEGLLRGRVLVDGICTSDSPVSTLACTVGMVLDDPETQLFAATVRGEAASGPENLLLPAAEIEKRVDTVLQAAGLSDYADAAPSTLSGGQKQRLAIASALALAGKVLVLDEPTSWLDNAGARELLAFVRSLREEKKLTVIMATHNSEEAARFADRVCVLENGAIAACAPPEAVFGDSALLERCGIRPLRCTRVSLLCANNESRVPPPQKDITGQAADAIQIKALNFAWEASKPLLQNISISIAHNDFMALAGPNGSGKSTLLKCISGLLRPDSGEIIIRGKNARQMTAAEISREIGFVTQNPDSQLFANTVYSEAAFALKNAGMGKGEIRDRVEAALAELGLENQRDAFPPALSRADRAKVVIASVLAMGSKIIFLDEPDAGQDYRSCRMIMDLAKRLHAKGYTIVFITHNIPLASEYSGRIVMMDGGKIAQQF